MIVIYGEPRSKARPRFAGHAYSAPRQREAEEELRHHLRPAFLRPISGNVAVAATFYRSTKHRIDLDNLVKLVLDAATGICWIDDIQVTEISARLELDRDAPRTELLISPTTSSLVRGADEILTCVGCGRLYTPREGVAAGYHSVECSRASRKLGTCAQLGEAPIRSRRARRGSSPRRGVSLRRDTGKWAAYVPWDGRRLSLGSFATEEEAIAAVDKFEGAA